MRANALNSSADNQPLTIGLRDKFDKSAQTRAILPMAHRKKIHKQCDFLCSSSEYSAVRISGCGEACRMAHLKLSVQQCMEKPG